MRKVFNVGINDSLIPTQRFEKINGKNKLVWVCPFYRKWKDMLKRCYYQKTFETYFECEVCKEWLIFSNFRNWCLSQNLKGNISDYHLDKDILHGSKIYSPNNCRLVPPVVNTFILESNKIRGNLPLGVNLNKSGIKYESYCRNPFIKRKQIYLGVFTSSEEAHEAWRKKKHEFACELSYSNLDIPLEVREVLRKRYSFENWYSNKNQN